MMVDSSLSSQCLEESEDAVEWAEEEEEEEMKVKGKREKGKRVREGRVE
jgi:hypothetical protein